MTMHSSWGSPAPVDPKKGFKIHLVIYLFVIPVSWLVWYLTDRTYLWPLWSTLAWGVGVLFHYLGVFVFKKSQKP